MTKNNKYPSSFELNEVCTNFIKRKVLNNFLQERGIFVFNAGADYLSRLLSNIVMQQADIEELRKNAYQSSTKSSLSGFIISSNSSISLNDIYEKARDNDRVLTSKGYNLSMLSHEIHNGKSIYKGRVDYELKRPGRIEFMDIEKSHSEFVFFENKEGDWQVEVDGIRANDGREIQKLFLSLIDKETTFLKYLAIENLTDKQTIDFFDRLAVSGMPKEWQFQDVKSLTFKRGREINNESDLVEETLDSVKEENSSLTGIRQAILDGINLREDAFVKKFEETGCIFTAMTFEYQHESLPEIIHIRAEFKGNPKIFEVSIVNSYEISGVEAKREASTLSVSRNRELRSIYWNNARNIYNDIQRM